MRETLQLPEGKCRKERGVDQVSQVIFDPGEDWIERHQIIYLSALSMTELWGRSELIALINSDDNDVGDNDDDSDDDDNGDDFSFFRW